MSVSTTPDSTEEAAKGGGKKKLVIGLLALVLIAGAVYWFVLRSPAEAEAAPVAGEVVALDPVQVNLAGGHYLRLGMALQLVEGAEEADGSKALDAAIDQFSGLPVGEVTDPATRQKLKKELNHHLDELYEGEVMDIYFTEFVTQ